MQKDLKIGILLGLVLIAVAAVWLSTRPRLSVESRVLQSRKAESLQSHNAGPSEETADEQPRFTANLPNTHLTETTAEIETEQTNVPDFTTHERRTTSNEQPDTRFHIVRKGETLSYISRKYYGSANKWQKIRDANRKMIEDADKLRPGTRLVIPD